MHKGDRVRVTAHVWTEYDVPEGTECAHVPEGTGRRKCLWRQEYEQPFVGLVIGKTRRQTGHYNEWANNGPEDGPPYLRADKTHIVWLVESLGTSWWREPITCLEADLEDLNGQRTD